MDRDDINKFMHIKYTKTTKPQQDALRKRKKAKEKT